MLLETYNVDETAMPTVQGKPFRILGRRGAEAERGTLVTALVCMNAIGNYIPLMLIFPRVRWKPELIEAHHLGRYMLVIPAGGCKRTSSLNGLTIS